MESSQNENENLIDAKNEICFKWMEYAWWKFDENFQTKQSIVEEITKKNERKEMEINLQKLHVQRKIWKDHNRNAIC
jgi:hypothetical protein